MLDKLMTALGLSSSSAADGDDYAARRTFQRRPNDKCVSVVNGKTLPVLDWSPGGIRVFADTRTVAVGEEVDVTLKFQMQDTLVNINHRAQIVRKARDSFAVQFLPLTSDIRNTFNQIIDNFNAADFAASQA